MPYELLACCIYAPKCWDLHVSMSNTTIICVTFKLLCFVRISSAQIIKDLFESFELALLVIPNNLHFAMFCTHYLLVYLIITIKYVCLLLYIKQTSHLQAQRAMYLALKGSKKLRFLRKDTLKNLACTKSTKSITLSKEIDLRCLKEAYY